MASWILYLPSFISRKAQLCALDFPIQYLKNMLKIEYIILYNINNETCIFSFEYLNYVLSFNNFEKMLFIVTHSSRKFNKKIPKKLIFKNCDFFKENVYQHKLHLLPKDFFGQIYLLKIQQVVYF